MKKILLFASIIFALIIVSCKGCEGTIIERQRSLSEICPTCVLTKGETSRSFTWLAQDTAKKPNVVYEVTFCSGILQPAWKVDYLTKLN